jgi:hypothetical protein
MRMQKSRGRKYRRQAKGVPAGYILKLEISGSAFKDGCSLVGASRNRLNLFDFMGYIARATIQNMFKKNQCKCQNWVDGFHVARNAGTAHLRMGYIYQLWQE